VVDKAYTRDSRHLHLQVYRYGPAVSVPPGQTRAHGRRRRARAFPLSGRCSSISVSPTSTSPRGLIAFICSMPDTMARGRCRPSGSWRIRSMGGDGIQVGLADALTAWFETREIS